MQKSLKIKDYLRENYYKDKNTKGKYNRFTLCVQCITEIHFEKSFHSNMKTTESKLNKILVLSNQTK